MDSSLLSQVSIHAWIIENQIKTENGQPLDFKNHRYLFDIYRDESRFLVCLKAGQIGFSTYAILKTIWLAFFRKLRIGYILPTEQMVEKFVGSKVNPIVQENPTIESWVADKDTVKQKQVGKGFIHYVGAQTATSAIMLTMDRLVIDEYDKAPPNILETFNSRLQHSLDVHKWVFSNPTIPDFGVDKFWQKSDKKKWHITHSCKETYVLDENCIDYQTEKYICPMCHEEITDEERRMGEWIATSQGEWSGYWIPLWINPMITAKMIAQAKRDNTPEYFANFVAGLPYLGGGDKVNAQTIINCIKDEVNTHSPRVIIGVDSGLPYHIVCANKEGYFYYDTLTSNSPAQELEKLLRRWPKSIIIADQGGDLTPIRDLQERYPGRVFLVWYRPDNRGLEMIKWGKDSEYGKVVADRNRLIQLFIDEMLDKRIKFNGTESEWQEYITHWLNIYRTWVPMPGEDENTGRKRFVWERNGPDHYVHASCYCRIGLSRFQEDMARIIGGEDEFGPPRGLRAAIPNIVDTHNADEVILTQNWGDIGV